MSLLNRMLGELATRQAPGSEALAGVQLTEPLAAAQSALSLRRVVLATALAVGAAALLWSQWPRTDIPSTAAVRVSSSTPPPLAAAAPQPAPPAAAPAAVAAPQPETSMRLPSLRMDSRLMLAQRPPESAARDASAAPAAPRAAPTARASDRAERSTPVTAPPEAKAADVTPTAAPQAAAVDAPARRKQSAREALARGEPAEALARLGADDGDTESSALRAAALQRLGQHEAAAASYRRLTESDPAEAAHWVGLGISLEGLQRAGEAGFSYRRALAMPTLAPTLRRFAQERLGAMGTP